MVPKIEHKVIDGKECKQCSGCTTYKQLDVFGKKATMSDGLQPSCKDCLKLKKASITDKITQYNKEYYQKNKEKENTRCKEYREAHPGYQKEYYDKWIVENKEIKKEKEAEYRARKKLEKRVDTAGSEN